MPGVPSNFVFVVETAWSLVERGVVAAKRGDWGLIHPEIAPVLLLHSRENGQNVKCMCAVQVASSCFSRHRTRSLHTLTSNYRARHSKAGEHAKAIS